MWRSLNELTGTDKFKTPKMIINDGETLYSPKKIAEALNEYYIENVDEIRNNFPEPSVDSMEILEKL